MNERIGTLLNRSGGEFYEGFLGSPNTIKFTEDELETFVGLIAKECAKVARNTDLEDVDGGDSAVLRAASEAIENYFGVK
jgi:hypothetical protein